MSNFPEYYKEIMSLYSAYKNGLRTEETKRRMQFIPIGSAKDG